MSPNFFITTTHSNTIDAKCYSALCKFVDNQKSLHQSHPAISNMSNDNDAGLLYNIDNKLRWTTDLGEISLLWHENKIIGISCVEHYNPMLSIGGIRFWIDSDYRSKNVASKFLLNSNLHWSSVSNKIGMILSFNEYNKIIWDSIKRKQEGKAAGLSTIWSNWWNNCIIVPNPVIIRHTSQWCVIKPINENKIPSNIYDIL